MSKIALSSNASGTGVFTIASLGTNTDRTITLPDATGTLFSSADIASQAQAEAGTDNVTLMTPLRVAQAIDAQNIYLAPLVTLSGSNVDFTGISSTARRVTVMFSGLSSNSTVVPLVQLGDAGGIEASGYNGTTAVVINAAATQVGNFSTGVSLSPSWTAAAVLHGKVTFDLMDAPTNLWAISGSAGRSDVSTGYHTFGGSKALSETLTQIRLAAGAASSFDAGSASISWE
jgi:hypothetical protein